MAKEEQESARDRAFLAEEFRVRDERERELLQFIAELEIAFWSEGPAKLEELFDSLPGRLDTPRLVTYRRIHNALKEGRR